MRAAGRGALLLLLVALGLWAVLAADGGDAARREGTLTALRSGPEIVLSDVEFREVRPDGAIYRMTCDRATYAVADETLAADGVVMTVPGRAGEVVVTAPRASWNLAAGRVILPDGGEAADDAGWSARVPEADVDLPARQLTAPEAFVAGPGLTVAGGRLVWRWKEGAVTLDVPRSRVEPRKEAPRRG